MKDNETSWRALAAAQHGAISHRQLVAAGLSRRQVETRVDREVLEPVFRRAYRVGGSPPSFEQRVMAACLATGGVASHRCAGALWGLRGCEEAGVELVVGGRRRPELAGVIGHTTSRLGPFDATTRRAIPVTTPARTLLDLGAVVSRDAVAAALEDAVHRRLVTLEWLQRVLDRAGASGRDGTAALRSALHERGAGAAATESTLEDEIVRLLREAGLPAPVRQYPISVPGHRRIRIDLCYPEARLAIEGQSLAWHGGHASLQADCDKLNLLVLLGWRLLTFTWADTQRRGRWLVDSVTAALSGVESTFGADTTAEVHSTPQRTRGDRRTDGAGGRYRGRRWPAPCSEPST